MHLPQQNVCGAARRAANQVKRQEAFSPQIAFDHWPEHVQREHVERDVGKAVMQKLKRDEPPDLVQIDNRVCREMHPILDERHGDGNDLPAFANDVTARGHGLAREQLDEEHRHIDDDQPHRQRQRRYAGKAVSPCWLTEILAIVNSHRADGMEPGKF